MITGHRSWLVLFSNEVLRIHPTFALSSQRLEVLVRQVRLGCEKCVRQASHRGRKRQKSARRQTWTTRLPGPLLFLSTLRQELDPAQFVVQSIISKPSSRRHEYKNFWPEYKNYRIECRKRKAGWRRDSARRRAEGCDPISSS
jgi:hypothetical protein